MPKQIVTRDDLRELVDAGSTDQNGFRYQNLVEWFTVPDTFGKLASDSEIGRVMNRDRRTIASWREVYEANR